MCVCGFRSLINYARLHVLILNFDFDSFWMTIKSFVCFVPPVFSIDKIFLNIKNFETRYNGGGWW